MVNLVAIVFLIYIAIRALLATYRVGSSDKIPGHVAVTAILICLAEAAAVTYLWSATC